MGTIAEFHALFRDIFSIVAIRDANSRRPWSFQEWQFAIECGNLKAILGFLKELQGIIKQSLVIKIPLVFIIDRVFEHHML